MIRSFIAIELKDKETIEKIVSFSSCLKQIQQRMKLIASENLHMTVKFLGNIQETLAPNIYSILKKDINEKLFQRRSFQYSLKGVGQFNQFSVLWIKLIGDISFLQNIKDTVENVLYKNLGVDRDKRTRFKPHLTIGRLKRGKINYKTFNVLKERIKENKDLEFGIFNISQLKLKKSQLTPKGPIYSDLVY